MPFMLWLVDHPPYPTYWTETVKAGVGKALKAHFDQVCSSPKTPYSSTNFSWANSNGGRQSDHLVLHFFRRSRDGLLYMWGQRSGLENSGATLWMAGKGMVSELYMEMMEGDANYAKLVANCAFHEAMHNKLDAHPQFDSFDVHKIKQGGLSQGIGISAGTRLTSADVNAMAPALTRNIPQF